MSTRSVVLTFVLFGGIIFRQTSGLRCYSCERCNDPFFPSFEHAQECKSDTQKFVDLMNQPLKCLKIRGTDGTVQRGCGGTQVGQFGSGCFGTIHGVVCSCLMDLCNTASTNVLSNFASITFSFLTPLLVRWSR